MSEPVNIERLMLGLYVLGSDSARTESGRRYATYDQRVATTGLSEPYDKELRVRLSPEQARAIIVGLWRALDPQDRPLPVNQST